MIRLGADTNLLICQKSKIQDWTDHFQAHYPKTVVYDLTKKGMVDEFVSRFNAWHGWKGASFTVGIINYELAWRRKDLLKLIDFTLMLDESSLIQHKTAKQTKFVLKLHPKNVILLSGTPTAGKYENLWTQAHLLGWEISDRLYQQQYINWKTIDVFDPQTYGTRKVKVVDKTNPYKNVDRLKAKLREHGASFLKTEEVMDLPEQNFIEVKMPVSKAYEAFMRDSIVTVGEREFVGDTSLTKRLYARQLCGIYSEAKLDAFRDLVYSTNDRLIVFYNFTAELNRLAYCLNDRPISIVNGSEKDLEAYENHDDAITFVQYQAGAKGLNLQKANKILYYSPTVKCDDWMQSQKRIHRIGQEQTCFYYVMMCRDSVEELIYAALKRGTDYTDKLFREDFNYGG